jgi:hypothetical protein
MSYPALWFGYITGSAFFYGVGLGLVMSPPITWGAAPAAVEPVAVASEGRPRNALIDRA